MRHDIWDAFEPLRERKPALPVKWVRPANIHLSLKFLGEVNESREAELRDALGRVAGAGTGGGERGRALVLQIEGCGVFPDYRRPHVLWVGVIPDAALELLQHGVEQAFAPLGFPPEARPFRPHVTVGRAGREARPRGFAGLEDACAAVTFTTSVSVTDVDLMQSTLQAAGPVYQVKHRERLS